MADELLPNEQARFFECSWVGQFRAKDRDKARLFAQYIADLMERDGIKDVGYDVRLMPREALEDPQSVRLVDEIKRASLPAGAEIPPADVSHPWDQGLWIFPADHPLARLERQARFTYELKPSDRAMQYVKKSMLMLAEGGGDGEDSTE